MFGDVVMNMSTVLGRLLTPENSGMFNTFTVLVRLVNNVISPNKNATVS